MAKQTPCAGFGWGRVFFKVAGIELCFGFVLKTVLIIKMFLLLLSSAYTELRSFLLLRTSHQ